MDQGYEQMAHTCAHTQMPNKYMKRCSTSLLNKFTYSRNEMSIFTTLMAQD